MHVMYILCYCFSVTVMPCAVIVFSTLLLWRLWFPRSPILPFQTFRIKPAPLVRPPLDFLTIWCLLSQFVILFAVSRISTFDLFPNNLCSVSGFGANLMFLIKRLSVGGYFADVCLTCWPTCFAVFFTLLETWWLSSNFFTLMEATFATFAERIAAIFVCSSTLS